MYLCRRLLVALVALAITATAMGAGVPRKKPAFLHDRAGAEIRTKLKLSGVSGWLLVDLDSGRVVDARNAGRPFAPASVAKLATAAYVLDTLGPDFRFETRIKATGKIRKGRVRGDLILEGGGDPELDTDDLVALAKALVASGVRRVDGAFLADGTALPQLVEISPGQADDSAYNPSVSGLNLNFNRVHVKWDARRGRRKLSVEAEADNHSPEVDRIRVAIAQRRRGRVFSYSRRGDREVWQMASHALRGRAARWLPVKRPEPYAGDVFRMMTGDLGVALPKVRLGKAPGGARVLARVRSRPLAQIVRYMLKFSTNITAEVAGAMASKRLGLANGTLAQSAAAMNIWAATVAGFKTGDKGFHLVNHSGLTLESRLSPRRTVDLLLALARRAPPSGTPDATRPGMIAPYLKIHNVALKSVPLDYDNIVVVAKTGTMNYVRGLAGYIATPGGRRLAFAIFSNDLSRRRRGAERVDRRWMARARGFEKALIRSWVIRVDGPGREG